MGKHGLGPRESLAEAVSAVINLLGCNPVRNYADIIVVMQLLDNMSFSMVHQKY
jgi:hypothetical protein